MAYSTTPQARSIMSPRLYDVFISHRGPDVKDTLAKQLYNLLEERGCKAFLDREEIEGGDSIPSAIENGILSSRVQIAIFSKGYAQSSWCLDELVLMLKQTDTLFLPVFYDVRPWELRHTENEKSQYAAAFYDDQQKRRNLDKVDEWREALVSASNISGYELSQHQDDLCEKIVSRVVKVIEEKRKSTHLHVAKYPVGLDELVQDFERCCSKKTGMVGIFGLGGSGKTTLAKELFNRKRSGYNASCFISDVREYHARGELHYLQSRLLKDLLKEDQGSSNIDHEIRSVDDGIGKLKDHLGRARHLHFLIILDDIDHENQLDALSPEGTLGSGDLVIITTRDQSVLRHTDFRYRMKGMDKDRAKELFCRHAFHGGNPPTAYEKLVENFVEFCGGLPLSLKVLGAHVYRRDEYYWELVFEKVQKIQPNDIMERLKISYDSLDREEKQIFIDIACLFNKKQLFLLKSNALTIWNAFGWSGEYSIQNLQDKCLVEVVDNGLYQGFEMHDHLRDLGRQMADELGPPRLWRADILRSMEANGFKQILAETKGRCFHSFWDLSLGRLIDYFIAETGLMWLEIYVNFHSLSTSIPSWIPLQKLQILYISDAKELWNSFQQHLQTNTQCNCQCQVNFELRKLKISNSPSLQKLPDLIEMFSHLKELLLDNSLEMTDTTSLVQSIKQLSNLRSLQLWSTKDGFFRGNFDLSKGRDSINSYSSRRMDSLETIILIELRNISKFVISGEMCPRLRSLELRRMITLREVELMQLDRLNSLTVESCPRLEAILGLSTLIGLQTLKLGGCAKLKWLPTLVNLRRLLEINITECCELQSVEGAEELAGLRSLLISIPDGGYALWLRNYIYGLRVILF